MQKVLFTVATIVVFSVLAGSIACGQDIAFHVAKKQPCIKKRNDLETEGLKGNVKTTVLKRYLPDLYFIKIVQYDSNGNWINQTIEEDLSDTTKIRNIRTYNKRGQLLNEVDSQSCSLHRYCTHDTKEYLYNDHGHLVQMEGYYYDEKGERRYYYSKFGENGDNAEEIRESVWRDYVTFKYNNCGLLTEKSESSSINDSTPEVTIYTYDERNRKVQAKEYDKYIGNLVPHSTTDYKYDDHDNEIEMKVTYATYTMTFSQQYDDTGHCIEYKKVDSEVGTDFDDSYKYEFDKKGNWVKQITYKAGKIKGRDEREIIYY